MNKCNNRGKGRLTRDKLELNAPKKRGKKTCLDRKRSKRVEVKRR